MICVGTFVFYLCAIPAFSLGMGLFMRVVNGAYDCRDHVYGRDRALREGQ